MQATLTWLDLTASDRDKMRRVLDLFKEQGTLDEMGLGSLRDALSDALFPGTSYIQTRLRYVLFIPWIYRRLEARKVRSSDVERAARAAEVDLIGRLEQNEDAKGVIGVVARGSLVRLPSSLYWSALTRWGIFQPQQGCRRRCSRASRPRKPTTSGPCAWCCMRWRRAGTRSPAAASTRWRAVFGASASAAMSGRRRPPSRRRPWSRSRRRC